MRGGVFSRVYAKFIRSLLVLFGFYIGYFIPSLLAVNPGWAIRFGGSLSGGVAGLIVAAIFCRFVLPRFDQSLQKISIQEILAGAIGLFFGLAVAGLVILSLPGTRFPGTSGNIIAGFILLFGVSISTTVAIRKREDLLALLGLGKTERNPLTGKTSRTAGRLPYKVLDTSAIIDGRIADLCQTGFLEGLLIVPGFVLAELQRIADSSDSLKRNRGRRGLDILNRMQKDPNVSVKIFDKDFDDLSEVDTKIVRLARMLEAKVITNDFNLNKVAELYGVSVLNINELSNAIKPVVLPGEEMLVHIIKDGKEYGQGVAYLEDGTMIVVDGGRQFIGEELPVVVTSVLQTAAGRMIFAKPKETVVARASSIS